MSIVIMLVHTYYGFTASGGPAGVGGGRRSRGAYLAGDLGIRRVSDFACGLWTVRQLQSGWLHGCYDRIQTTQRHRPGWWTLLLVAFVAFSVWLSYSLFTGTRLAQLRPGHPHSDRPGL
jgi:hypothetical protein